MAKRLTGASTRIVACSVADQVFVSGSNILLNIVLARWLTKSEFGAFGALFSTFTLVVGFHNALLLEPMSVFGGGVFRRHVDSYKSHLLRLQAAFATVFLPVLFLLGWLLAPPSYSALAFSACLFAGTATVLLYYMLRRGAYVSREYGTALLAGGVSLIVTLAGLYLAHAARVLTWTTAFVLQALASLVASSVLFRRRSIPRFTDRSGEITFRVIWRSHWNYGRWALATALVFWFSAEAYCVLIARLAGPVDAAGFRAVQTIAMLLPNFITALSVLALPLAATHYADGGERHLRDFVTSFGLVSTAAAILFSAGLMISGTWVITKVYGPGYSQFSAILPALCCNLILIAASQSFQMAVRAMNAPRIIFEAFLTAALCTCTVGVALTRVWGLQGACVGLCISSAAFVFVLVRRYRVLTGGTASSLDFKLAIDPLSNP